ncbi:MAG: hypothetical protein QOK12_3879 [Mycobacterium sp.]|jgi:hypothetical protein|nr:hypothetical protein [Mycobacterium sp.]
MGTEAEHDQEQDQRIIPMPDVTDEHRERAKEMAKAYDDDRPTVSVPGTSNTVTGQAVADWLDDEGNPKYGEVAHGGIKHEDVMGKREKGMTDE